MSMRLHRNLLVVDNKLLEGSVFGASASVGTFRFVLLLEQV